MRIKIQTGLILLFWLLAVLILLPGGGLWAYPFPDTGQTKCYNNTVEIPCPSPGQAFYGQDGNYNINPNSYTKLDASGNTLPNNAATWTMVKDNVTGLIWEMKTTDGSLHDKNKTFTWCNKDTSTNGGIQGTCGTGTGSGATDTEAFINALNAANYGGHNDWRMPTVKELSSLVNSSIPYPGPTIDTAWFPNSVSSKYWSSTTRAHREMYAWLVGFDTGNVDDGDHYKYESYYVRAVRAGQSGSLGSLVINGDGTATDTGTGLMWQKATAPGTYTWQQALAYVATLNSAGLAGYSDWRLPNRNELQSLVDYSRYNPAVVPLLAADTVSSNYWSSTTDVNDPSGVWLVDFYYGYIKYPSSSKSNSYYVRAVRAGQSGSLSSLYASFNGSGVWKFDGTAWTQATPNNPQLMVTSGSTLYASFAGGGVWKWDGSTWTQATPNNPQQMVTEGNNLYGTFTGAGIWKFNGSTWTQATLNNPQQMVISGSTLYGSFTGGGIWKFDGSNWTQATPNNPVSMVATPTTLYGTFAGTGIWKWNGATWTQATPNSPQTMVSGGETLYGAFTGRGVWKLVGSTWTQITPNTPQQMAASESAFYGVFTGGGIWKFDGSTWTQVTANDPVSMVLGQ